MTTPVSNSYTSPFQISGALGLGTASLLGGDASNTSPSAANVLASNAADAGALSTLSAASSNSALDETTLLALAEGRLTGAQHKVVAALATAPKGTYELDWSKGVEPSVIAAIRKLGWIKLIKPHFDAATRLVTGADYQLTTVGKAIYKRTDNAVATGPNSAGQPTLASLGADKITTGEAGAITTIATNPKPQTTFGWPQGQEPSILSQLRKKGWVELVLPNYNTATLQFSSASYKLSDLGKKIYQVTAANAAASGDTSSSNVSTTA